MTACKSSPSQHYMEALQESVWPAIFEGHGGVRRGVGANIGQQTGAEPGLRTGELNKPRSFCIVACAC